MASQASANPAAKLDSLTPAQMAMIPVAPPPPGVIPNFEHPASRLPEFLGAITPFLIIATVCFGVRLYTKVFALKKWRPEDTTLTLGYILTLMYYIMAILGGVYGNNGKHIWELHLSTMYSSLSFWTTTWATSCLPSPALGLLKATLFLQYSYLFKPNQWMRVAIFSGLAVTVLYYTGATIAGLVWTTPRTGETLIDASFSSHMAGNAILYLPTAIVGVILDWYLIILPIPAVLALKLSTSKKIGVLAIFMTGGIAGAASITSLALRTVPLSTVKEDPLWSSLNPVIWLQIELCCGIITACAPAVHLFWNKHAKLTRWSSRLKASMRTMLGLTSSGHSRPRKSEDQQQIVPMGVPVELEKSCATDEILVIQDYSVNRSERSKKGTWSQKTVTTNDSEFGQSQSVLYLEDLEAQGAKSSRERYGTEPW